MCGEVKYYLSLIGPKSFQWYDHLNSDPTEILGKVTVDHEPQVYNWVKIFIIDKPKAVPKNQN